jgi:hypothetical protein
MYKIKIYRIKKINYRIKKIKLVEKIISGKTGRIMKDILFIIKS